MTNPPSPPAAKPPSLFGGAANDSTLPTQPGTGETMRMLSGLEVTFLPSGEAATRSRPPWRLLAGVLGLVAAVALAFFWLNREPAPDAPSARVASAPLPVQAAASTAAPLVVADAKEATATAVPQLAAPSASAAPALAAPAVAVIERVSPPVVAAAPAVVPTAPPVAATTVPTAGAASADAKLPPATLAVMPPGATSPVPRDAPASPAAAATPPPRAVAPAARPGPATRVASARSAHAREVSALTRPAVRTASAGSGALPPAATTVPPRSPQESDVDLLTAMVAHLQGFGPPPAAPVAGEARARTISQMVHSCTKLGGKDGDSCRRRICAGYWGKDHACPMRMAPRRTRLASGSP